MNKFTPTIIATLVIGVVLGYIWSHTQTVASYEPKIQAVNKVLPPPNTQATSVEGRVKQIDANSITLEGVAVSMNPFAAGNYPTTRQVTITDMTKFMKIAPKDPAQFQKELLAFQNSIVNKSQAAPVPPSPFTETTIQLSDIKVGDSVSATAASDIINAASFTATQIQLNSIGANASPKS